MRFADSDTAFEDAFYVIFGAPFDGTSCFRKGSRKAPTAIREQSYNFETYDDFFGVDLADVAIHDAGDLTLTGSPRENIEKVRDFTASILEAGKTPVMLGGEHSLTLGCIEAITADVGVVVLDAHLDLRNEYMGERFSHATVSCRVLEMVGVDRFVSLGIRSGSQEEYRFARKKGVKFYSAEDIRTKGIETVLEEVVEHLGDLQLYLSVDADVLDPAYAPALGTPEPYGLTPLDVRSTLRVLSGNTVGFDLVEIAPHYDLGNTALLGAKIVRDFVAAKLRACWDSNPGCGLRRPV